MQFDVLQLRQQISNVLVQLRVDHDSIVKEINNLRETHRLKIEAEQPISEAAPEKKQGVLV